MLQQPIIVFFLRIDILLQLIPAFKDKMHQSFTLILPSVTCLFLLIMTVGI